jgi:hypothetical protein
MICDCFGLQKKQSLTTLNIDDIYDADTFKDAGVKMLVLAW